MNRFVWMPFALLLAACSGTDSVSLDPSAPQPSQPAAADAAAQPDVTQLPPADDAGTSADAAPQQDDAESEAGMCSGYAEPLTTAACHACTSGNCQPNGCFGGYYCDLLTEHCVAKPDGC
jgi:hypothetical protein